ncbi:RING1 and YY1-binding protein B [Cheilinus undulatus]|uniref:RING1 and YY1-binding protein B n=1 Tax=Cheilinus undulatus TaxID=241271 RepID=UPI001BD52CD5|nr:RING1 and YY1-binding protein B [Cheilinus undulatus]
MVPGEAPELATSPGLPGARLPCDLYEACLHTALVADLFGKHYIRLTIVEAIFSYFRGLIVIMGDKKSPTRPKRQAKQTADEGYWDCSVCTFRNTAEAFKCSICDVRKGTSTRKPRINSQLVAQQVAQQYPMPPPPKKERKERSERIDKERPDGEGEPTIGEQRPERVEPEVDTSVKEKDDKDQPVENKPDTEKDFSPIVTKKPNSKKTRPKSDHHQSPHSILSGKSTTKTNKNSYISRPKLKNIDRSTAQQLAITVGNVTVIITDFKEKTRSSSTSSSTITSSVGSEQHHQSSGSESMDKSSSRASTPKGDLSLGQDESF